MRPSLSNCGARTRFSILLVCATMLTLVHPAPARAHTDFDGSLPIDGAVVTTTVEEIRIAFTGPAEPTGEGFVVLAGQETRIPEQVATPDGSTWVLTFDPPLAARTVGVRWTVQAPDSHPINGSFSFLVDIRPSSASSSSAVESPVAAARPPPELESFLDDQSGGPIAAAKLASIGRFMSLIGALVGLGALSFAVVVLRGPEAEVKSVLFWVRRMGALLAVGAATEFLARIALERSDWFAVLYPSAVADVAFSSLGVAILLRGLGGWLLSAGATMHVKDAREDTDPVLVLRELVPVGAGPAPSPVHPGDVGTPVSDPSGHGFSHREPYLRRHDQAWLAQSGRPAFLGAAIVLSSFLFDGHTVTEGARWFHAFINVVHVSAAAVWSGGLMMLASVLWRRHRRGEESRALQLAVRFSVVAALALVVAGIAGTILTVIVVDNVSDLWLTSWGRVLIAKVLLVAVAAASGGYNHKYLIPMMVEEPNERILDHRFRRAVTIEAVSLGLVFAATSVLIAASTQA